MNQGIGKFVEDKFYVITPKFPTGVYMMEECWQQNPVRNYLTLIMSLTDDDVRLVPEQMEYMILRKKHWFLPWKVLTGWTL
jgi:hypothetical protein